MAMKSYPSFKAWMDDQTPSNQKHIKSIRSLIRKHAPELQECVKWGNGCFVGKNNGVIYLYAHEEYLQYGFFNGVALKDSKKRLEGSGAYIRHVKVRKASDIDKPYFADLLQQAVRIEAASPTLPTKNNSIFKGISRPALSALAEARINTLSKLAKHTEAEILALHGVGPASIPKLRSILKAAGLSFKEE